jgi:hypothetical protein
MKPALPRITNPRGFAPVRQRVSRSMPAGVLTLILALSAWVAAASSWERSFTVPQGTRQNFTFLKQASDGGSFVISIVEDLLPPNGPTASSSARGRLVPRTRSSPSDYCLEGDPRRVIVLRTDSLGAALWINEYKVEGAPCMSVNDLTATSDGGAILVGSTTANYPGYVTGSNAPETIVFRLDNAGSVVWSGAFLNVFAYTIKPKPDGRYLIAAGLDILTLNANGSLDSALSAQGQQPFDVQLGDVLPTADGFFVCGDAPQPPPFEDSPAPFIAQIVGSNVVWEKIYPASGPFQTLEMSPDQALVAQATGEFRETWKVGLDGTPQWAVTNDRNELGKVDPSGRIVWPDPLRLSADGQNLERFLISEAEGQDIALPADGTIIQAGWNGSEVFLTKYDPSSVGCLNIRTLTPDPMAPVLHIAPVPSTMTFASASIPTLPLTVVRNCLTSVARTECLPSAKTGIQIQQVGGSCDTNVFKFDLDPATVVATPNPWNTPALARVLTHKYGTGDTYPSMYQIDRGDVHLRPRFRFPGTATSGGAVAATKVWFRVIDPPDTAPYVVLAGDAHANDNKDPFSGGKGILMTAGCTDLSAQSTCATLNGNVLATTSTPDGRVEVVLEATDQYAGDNYQILASFAAPGPDGRFPCEASAPATCSKSASVTTWKRIYLEQRSMFRRGSFLLQDAQPGDSDVFVKDVTPFRSGDKVALIHSTGGGERPVIEAHVIDVVAKQRGALAHLHLRDNALAGNFSRNTADDILGDAVGVSNGGGSPEDIYFASLGPPDTNGTTSVNEFFNTMFIDAQAPPPELQFVPLVAGLSYVPDRRKGQVQSDAMTFAEHWFHLSLSDGVPPPNQRMLIGAAHPDDDAIIGVTTDHFPLASYSFRGQIEDFTSSAGSDLQNLDPEIVTFENTAHELMHQWRVNKTPVPPGGDAVGHCAENAFDNPRTLCKMHKGGYDASHNSERGDGILALHYVNRNGTVDSEYLTVRQAAEPMP